jgi:ABC-type multidrug transport system ATPase subunit
MDEADVLGNRVAVIDAGKLQEVGSPAELKVKYGKGLHLSVSVGTGADREEVLRQVRSASGVTGVKVDISDHAEDDAGDGDDDDRGEVARKVTRTILR